MLETGRRAAERASEGATAPAGFADPSWPPPENGRTAQERKRLALAGLRRQVARIKGERLDRLEVPARRPGEGLVPTGIAAFDRLLGGGIAPGLTELRLAETRDAGAGIGFALALAILAGASPARPLLWIAERFVFDEAGHPCRAGIEGFGLCPDALLLVRTRRLEDAVWAGEEAVRSGAVACVVLEVRGNPRLLGLEGTRRLHLRAQASRAPCLLLRQAGRAEPTAAPFRLRIEPGRGRSSDDPAGALRLLGRPSFRIAVEKSSDGRLSHLILEWNADEHRFQSLTLPRAVAAAAADRADTAPEMGRVVAFARQPAGDDLRSPLAGRGVVSGAALRRRV